MAEVTSSSLVGSTLKTSDLQVERRMRKSPRIRVGSFVLQPYCDQGSPQSVPHRFRGMITHRGHVVRIGTQGHSYGGVAQEFLYKFGMDTSA
jgi:hypothetical protein